MSAVSGISRRAWGTLASGAFVAAATWLAVMQNPPRDFWDWWATPDRQGDALLRRGWYAEAAGHFRDPFRVGVAWFRAGQFDRAALAFGSLSSPEADYNGGNALVMLGKYERAIAAYDRALAGRPAWPEAVRNREIAQIRADRLKAQGGDETEDQTTPDDVVYDSTKKGDDLPTTAVPGGALSDQALQALWLQRIQTKPADFLRAKFAFQRARENATPPPGNSP